MIVGIPKETVAGERRVALVPDLVAKLTGSGLEHERKASFEAGFDHHLLKPASPDTILTLLK